MDKDICTRLGFENTIILANFLTAAELLNSSISSKKAGEVLKDCTEDNPNSLKFKMVTEKTVFEY